MLISGNPTQGLARALHVLYPDAEFCSRATGYDLTKAEDQQRFGLSALNHRIVVINSALWKFNQTVLLDTVYRVCVEHTHNPHIICIGSTTDRVKNGKPWLYNAEKKALRDYANTLALGGVWDSKPKVTLVSFGTLDNNQHKHPDRKTMNITVAAEYIRWIIDQPQWINVNELSIDPMQDLQWYSQS